MCMNVLRRLVSLFLCCHYGRQLFFLLKIVFLDEKLQHNFGIDSILDGLVASDEPAVIMADRHVLHLSIILSSFLVLASYI